MIDHLRQSGRFFAIISAMPFMMGFTSAWLAAIGFILFVFGLPVLIGVFAIGAAGYLVQGIRIARQAKSMRDRAIAALAAPFMIGMTLVVAWPSLGAGNFIGTWTRLMVNRGHYEAIIERAKRGHRSPSTDSSAEVDGSIEYVVDAGPPVRVAFNPEGMLDNWSGIIFDPTGEVMLAKGFDGKTGKFAAPDRVTKLFGGDLVGCRHLWGNYYDCSFT
ncbi:hypothetical protein [Sphingomonas yabuuchiae]|uniref:Uncharacterized protein n=1 Tax=Sphingomonas yabuuchiae TaxID=172044 RepID=A0ABR6K728_9SPHN|nr:hypothetical protein [Sphingomonas yabuuchiae]MBB4608893.1 hypothetical protein [Sphingomonas yabuuchiae]